MNISDLILPTRTKNCLNIAGLTTVEQIIATPAKAMLRWRNFGPRCLTELFAILDGAGFRHPDDDFRLDREQVEQAIISLTARIKKLRYYKKNFDKITALEQNMEAKFDRWRERDRLRLNT